MKLYADTPTRRTRQLLADVFILLWVGFWLYAGRQVHDLVSALRSPADSITSAGVSVNDALTGAGQQAQQIPFVGDQLRTWLTQAAGSGTTLEQAGTSMGETIDRLAFALGLATALAPISIVVAVWLWMRVRFVRAAPTPSASSTRARTSTSSRCGRWRASRCGRSPRSRTTRPARGAGRTARSSGSSPCSSCATRACGHPPAPDLPPLEWPLRLIRLVAAQVARPLEGSVEGSSVRVTWGRRSSVGGVHDAGSAGTCSPERMSLTSPCSPAAGNHTNGMPRRSA